MQQQVKLLILISSIIAPLVITDGAGQGKSQQAKLQSGKETLIIRPYRGAGYDLIPVDVLGLAIKDERYDFKVTKVELKNRSSKPVQGVAFNWVLTKEEEGSSVVVRKGIQTPFIKLPSVLSTGDKLTLESPDFNISKVFLNEIESGGDYHLEIAVSDVLYADGTSWKPYRRVWRI